MVPVTNMRYDPRLNLTAILRASHMSFALGKQNWTISGDKHQCSEGNDYTIALKLTGCQENEFTCNDGQCIRMEERCDQLPQCEDKSDEQNCKLLVLEHGYNKKVLPLIAHVKKKKRKRTTSGEAIFNVAKSGCNRGS